MVIHKEGRNPAEQMPEGEQVLKRIVSGKNNCGEGRDFLAWPEGLLPANSP